MSARPFGSTLATGVGLMVTGTGVLIDQAAEGGAESAPNPGPAIGRARPGTGCIHRWVTPPPTVRPRRSAGSLVGVVVAILLVFGGVGFGVAYGAQLAGHKLIAFLDEQSQTPAEKKTNDPGAERLSGEPTGSAGTLP